uniref:Ion transport domain-containing protein n=1 Tax=Rhizophagus irregularis (strain DAOM 181602 / DAOM 197198 / MUCL 43194) TaxID=747089 RepID=U9TU87_RHIID
MISVGKKISSFLVVLFIIIISFAHTFYILLSPKSNFSFEKKNTNNDDPNNPWNIAPAYYQLFDNGTVNQNQYMIQLPDGNTNMFVDFGTAIFAMYLFLIGDSSALSNWTYKDNPSLVILIVLFSLLVVVYLMNLLIGLLNNAIEKDNNKASYLVQKAEILAEIELLYLLPHQRRWQKWFPDVIYYYADVDKVRQKIKEMINEGEWNTDEFLELKQDLLNRLNIQHNPVDETTLKNILEEIRDLRSKLSQQQ